MRKGEQTNDNAIRSQLYSHLPIIRLSKTPAYHTAGEIDTAAFRPRDSPLDLPPLGELSFFSSNHSAGDPSSPNPPVRGDSGLPPTPLNRGENVRAEFTG